MDQTGPRSSEPVPQETASPSPVQPGPPGQGGQAPAADIRREDPGRPAAGTAHAAGAETRPEAGPDVQAAGFEAMLAELETIVQQLETGEHGLDQALELFQRGVKLARSCRQWLDAMERRIEWLLADAGGDVRSVAAPQLMEEADGP